MQDDKVEKISDFQLERIAWRTILGKFEDVKFSIFYYKYPLLYPMKKFGMVNVIDLHDIAAMKIAAIASRGTKRDFVDIYFMCKEAVSLPDAIQLYGKKYNNLSTTEMHIMKSLIYFEDAEPDDMPEMLKKADWEEMKEYFKDEVTKLAKPIR